METVTQQFFNFTDAPNEIRSEVWQHSRDTGTSPKLSTRFLVHPMQRLHKFNVSGPHKSLGIRSAYIGTVVQGLHGQSTSS